MDKKHRYLEQWPALYNESVKYLKKVSEPSGVCSTRLIGTGVSPLFCVIIPSASLFTVPTNPSTDTAAPNNSGKQNHRACVSHLYFPCFAPYYRKWGCI